MIFSINKSNFMKKIGMQAVDEAIENGIDLDGTPIPSKMLELYNRLIDFLTPLLSLLFSSFIILL